MFVKYNKIQLYFLDPIFGTDIARFGCEKVQLNMSKVWVQVKKVKMLKKCGCLSFSISK